MSKLSLGRHVPWFCLPLLAVSVAILLFTSCFPQWLADSNSILYVTPAGQVMLRDVDRQESRQLLQLEMELENKKIAGLVLAPRPDGKEFVVARWFQYDDKFGLVLDFYSLDGKKDRSSEEIFIEEKPVGSYSPAFFNVSWSARGKYVVANQVGIGFSVFYNVETKKHLIQKKHRQLVVLDSDVWPTRNQLTPDESGYISLETRDDKTTFILKSVETGEKLAELDASQVKQDRLALYPEEPRALMVHLPAYWEGNTLVQPSDDGELLVDIEKRKVTFRTTEHMSSLLQHAKQTERKVVGEITDNILVELQGFNLDPDNARELTTYNLRTKKRQNYDGLDEVVSVVINKSPNGQRTLVNVISTEKPFRALVFDAEGELIDEFAYDLDGTDDP